MVLSFCRTDQEEGRFFATLPEATNAMYNMFAKVENNIIFTLSSFFGTSLQSTQTDQSTRAEGDDFFDTYTAIYIYTGLIVGLIGFTIFRSFLFFRCASNSSKNLHAKMFSCLLKTPMRFFDTNASGRILNRFSKDTGAMDETLPRILSEAVQVFENHFVHIGLV